MKKAVLYLRYSSNSQSEQSIEGQRGVCQRYADQQDIAVIDEYIDRATSASHDTKKRLSFQQMIKDAADHNFDYVIVYKLDRFSRNRHDFATYRAKLADHDVRVLSATEGLSDRPESILLESMLEGYAEYYSRELAQKVQRGIDESVKKRQWLGGPTPLGFRVENQQLVPDPATAPIVREIFNKVLEGWSYRQIAEWAASKGIRSPRGKPYTHHAFWRILHSKRYIGHYVYKDVDVPGVIEPIVDETTFNRVQRRLERVAKKHHDNTDYLLSRKLFCGHCGRQMNGEKGRGRHGKYYYYYTCLGRKKYKDCQKATVRKDEIEGIVIEKARGMLTDDVINKVVAMMMAEYAEKLKQDNPFSALRQQLSEIEKQIENGLNAVLNGFASKPLADRLESLNQQKEQLQMRLEEIEASRVVLDPDRLKFYLYTLRNRAGAPEQRKRLIDTFVRKVILWDDLEDSNHKMQIVYNLNGEPERFDLESQRTTIVNGHEPIRADIDAMVVIVNYTLSRR